MKTVLPFTVASIIAAFASAYTPPSAPSAQCAPCNGTLDTLALTETVGVYTKKENASTVTALDSLFTLKALGLDWRVDVPVYISDTSGYGSIEVGTTWTPLHGMSFLGADTAVTVDGGLFTPTGSAGYEATTVIPHVGAGAVLDWGALSFGQSVDWRFVGGSMYDPLLGTVAVDLATLVSSLDYKWTDCVSVGVDLKQYYLQGGDGAVTLTPNLQWTAASNVDVSAGVGVPVWQNLAVENNLVFTAGVSFKF